MKKLNYEINKLIEQAYRKGYSHGFNFGSAHNSNIDCEKKIREWTNDLFIMTGAPGSRHENVEMKWCDTDSGGYIDDIILKKYWNDLEEKALKKN